MTSPDTTFTLKAVLEQSGFLRDVFNDPTTALANFKADYYDLMLLDVKMPQMEIKKKRQKRKSMFFHGYESQKKEFPKLDVGCFIRKPIDIDDLVKRINNQLFD